MVNLPFWERVPFHYASYGKDSDELRAIIRAYIPCRENSMTKLLELKERIGF
jgi:hypothetical protein